MSSEPSLRDIGRAVSQLHLKVSRIAETLGECQGGGAAEARGGGEGGLEGWLELVDAVDAGVEAAAARRHGAGEARKRFWQRSLSKNGADEDLWRGLQLAAAEAHERVARMGIELVPEDGKFDPRWHRAIETVPAADPSLKGTIANTHQRGWMRRALAAGGTPVVLRTALVTVYQG